MATIEQLYEVSRNNVEEFYKECERIELQIYMDALIERISKTIFEEVKHENKLN